MPTVFAARQFVNHGHVKVNGRRVNIASYQVKVGDVVEVKESSKQLALVLEATGLAERDVPDYHRGRSLQDDREARCAFPALGDVPYPVHDGTEPRRRILFALIISRSRM